MTEMNSWQDIIRRSGFVHDAAKGDHLFFGLAVGGQYNATNPTLTDKDWGVIQLDASGRVKCILDGATITIGGDLDVDVSAFVNSSGSNVEGAMVFTHAESLAAKTDIWQGFGGWDKTGDTFRAFPISIDDAAMPATPDFVGVGGEYRASATTYTDGDATILQTDINGAALCRSKIWDGTTTLDILTQDSAFGATSKGLAIFGKYQVTPTTYADGDACPFLTDANGRLITNMELNDYTDDSAEFTVAASKGLAIMGLYTTDAVDAGDIAAIRIDANRNVGITSTADIPTTLTGGSKTVTAAGTAEALGTTLATKSIYIRAKSTNTSFICIGDSGVDESTNQQIVLYANDAVTLDISNRMTVYVDADVSGEGVDYLAMS